MLHCFSYHFRLFPLLARQTALHNTYDLGSWLALGLSSNPRKDVGAALGQGNFALAMRLPTSPFYMYTPT